MKSNYPQIWATDTASTTSTLYNYYDVLYIKNYDSVLVIKLI